MLVWDSEFSLVLCTDSPLGLLDSWKREITMLSIPPPMMQGPSPVMERSRGSAVLPWIALSVFRTRT